METVYFLGRYYLALMLGITASTSTQNKQTRNNFKQMAEEKSKSKAN